MEVEVGKDVKEMNQSVILMMDTGTISAPKERVKYQL